MYTEFFVLISPEFFGVYQEGQHLPLEFKQNLKYVECVKYGDLAKYLLDNLGRNILVNKGFRLPYSIGRLYSRTPS